MSDAISTYGCAIKELRGRAKSVRRLVHDRLVALKMFQFRVASLLLPRYRYGTARTGTGQTERREIVFHDIFTTNAALTQYFQFQSANRTEVTKMNSSVVAVRFQDRAPLGADDGRRFDERRADGGGGARRRRVAPRGRRPRPRRRRSLLHRRKRKGAGW